MRRLGVVLGAIALIAFAWLYWQGSPSPPIESTSARENAAPADPQGPPEAGDNATVDAPPERTAAEPPIDADNPADTAPASEIDKLACVRGTFVLPSGTPALDVAVTLDGWVGDSERELRYGAPKEWPDITGSTGPDGAFALYFDPPLAFQFTLKGKLDGYAREQWRWTEIAPGEIVDVGRVTLRPGGTLRGRVVNEDGESLPGWHVYAKNNLAGIDHGRDSTRESTSVDPVTHEYILRDLPPGPATLSAYLRIANWIHAPETVEVKPGQEVTADIVYRGPDYRERITVTVFTTKFFTVRPESESIRLLGADGSVRTAHHLHGSSQSEVFDELPLGSYSVVIDDPRFDEWRRDGVAPGTSIDAHLTGSAGLRLVVTDRTTGVAIDEYRLRVLALDASSFPNEFELRAMDEPAPEGGWYRGIVPASYRVQVTADGYAESTQDVELLPGAMPTVEIAMHAGIEVHGTVHRADGRAVEGVKVWAYFSESTRIDQSSREADQTTTDESGAFLFSALGDGTFVFTSGLGHGITATSPVTQIAAPNPPPPVALVLPDFGEIVGTVTPQPPADLEGMSVHVDPTDAVFGSHTGKRAAVVPVTEGTFRVGPIPHGRYRLSLGLPAASIPTGRGAWSSGAPATRELGEVTLERDLLEVTYPIPELLPGSVSLAITIDQQPAGGATALLSSTTSNESVSALADSDGVAHFPTVFPGDWNVFIRDADRRWQVPADAVRVTGGQLTRATAAVTTTTAAIQIVDPRGEPLAETDVWLQSKRGSQKMTTDANGHIELTLAHGDYAILASRSREHGLPPSVAKLLGSNTTSSPDLTRSVSFRWGIGGPVPAVLTLDVEPVER